MTLDLAMIFWSAIKSTSNKRPNRWIGLPQQDKLLCIKGARKKIIHHPKWHNMFVIMYLMTSVAHPPSPRWPWGVPVGSLPSQVIRGFQAPGTHGVDTGHLQHPQGVSAGWFWAQVLSHHCPQRLEASAASRRTQSLWESLRTKRISLIFLKSTSYFTCRQVK